MTHFDLAAQTAGSLVRLAVPMVVAFVCFCAALGLRLARRGAARFWTGPAVTALALLPGVAGVAMSAMGFREVLEGMALTGPGGVAAVAGGSAESLLPMLAGLACVAGLAVCGLLLVAAGTSRVREGAVGGGAASALLSPLQVALALGLVALLVGTIQGVNAGPPDPGGVLLRWRLCFFGSAGLAALLVGQVFVSALRAPRCAAPTAIKLASIASLAAAGVGAVVGSGVVYGRVESLARIALTGAPRAEAPPSGAAVPVAGAIREPKKLHHVPPVYPEIARQARVQGVVVLECTISPEGGVSEVKVLRGIPLLDAAAAEAVRQWVYEPTLLNGLAVPVTMQVTVTFKLSQEHTTRALPPG